MSLLSFLYRLVERENFAAIDAERAMLAILDGEATTAQIAAFLVALRMKGETSEELLGFARAMRARSERVNAELGTEPLIDTCGTGGDGMATFNISTTAALVVAASGVRVAKHGNRSVTSRCGSADVLEALGVKVAQKPEQAAAAIREVGIGFLFAPAFHPAMRFAREAREELRMRTIFNLLGPLTNPAGARRQLVGAPSQRASELMAGVLASLGCERGFVVHGSDGLDEVTTTGATYALEITAGGIADRTLTPDDFGVPQAAISDLRGGDVEQNTEISRAILQGAPGPQRDIVLVNAATALVASGKAADFVSAMRLAAESVDSGAAWKKLQALAEFTQRG